MVKALCGDLVNEVLYDCVQFHGGVGFMRETRGRAHGARRPRPGHRRRRHRSHARGSRETVVNMSTSLATSAIDGSVELPLKEVLPGILMFTLPVDYGIDHVNIYLIRDGEGWCLFDTGADCEAARALWLRALEGPLAASLTRIIVSHHHPDHLGLAVWLHERTGAPILMREEELTVARQTHVRQRATIAPTVSTSCVAMGCRE